MLPLFNHHSLLWSSSKEAETWCRPFLSYLDFACRSFSILLLVHAHHVRVLPHYTATIEFEAKIRQLPCLKFDTKLSGIQHIHFLFAIDGVTSDLWPWNNKGWSLDRQLCRIFDHYSFRSAKQNCINHRKSDVIWPLKHRMFDEQKCLRNGGIVGF